MSFGEDQKNCVWNSHVVIGVGFSPVEFLWFLLNALLCYQRWCAGVNSWTGRLIVWTCICFKCLDAASIRNRFVSEALKLTESPKSFFHGFLCLPLSAAWVGMPPALVGPALWPSASSAVVIKRFWRDWGLREWYDIKGLQAAGQ